MSLLFSPLHLPSPRGGLTLPNRIVVAPMCQYAAQDGAATDWHLMHWGNLLNSGAGLFTIEATAVLPEGRITPACLGLWDERTEAALADTLQRARRLAPPTPICIQLAHAGRKASSAVPWQGGQLLSPAQGGWQTAGPSALPQLPSEPPPTELSLEAMADIRTAFVVAAQRSAAMGIEAIELHAAHGYLLHQFLSPVANQRDDEYGGSPENRMRFPLAVFAAVHRAVGDRVELGVRISATDWVEGAWDIEQSLAFSRALRERGADFIHVSSGGVSPLQKIALGAGYQVHLAERIKREVGLPTMAVGLITEPKQAEAIIAEGRADLVALARGILYDPHWPWHAAAELGATVAAPPQYWRCPPRVHATLFGDIRTAQR